ncbi:hypothetical protein L0F63_005679 [Massospora cicadina]|nr:hypothetical protein L0F63_005679 [Massospora cicadina]
MGKSKSRANRKLASVPGERSVIDVFKVDIDKKIKHQRDGNLDEVERSKYEIDEVASEDDEEIDSDYAYGETDEVTPSVWEKQFHRLEGAFGEESDEEELQGDGFINLSELLDEEPEPTASLEAGSKTKVSYHDLLPIQEESEDEEVPEMSDLDGQENDELSEFVKKLDSNLKVRKFLKEQTETYKESEFNLTLRPSSKSDKLSIADLLAPMQDEAGFTALEKKVQQFSGKKKELAPLAVPLAKRISDRVVRSTAYEHAKERISEWQPIINQNREAEHLNFCRTPVDSTLNSTLSNAAKPETKLEKEIHSILVQSNLKDNDIQKAEELELSKLSPEAVLARQRELRMMRDLMFRNEAKAKRISKIKSKAYHRIKKKERERAKQIQSELGSDKEDQMEVEAARAKERMTLKHKNTGKWAKALLKHGGRHSENQTALMEQLDEHQRLKRKMTGAESDQDSDLDSDQVSGGEDPREQAFKEIDRLVSDPSQTVPLTKGVMGMKFMQNAMKRQEQEVERLAKEAIEDLKLLTSDHEDAHATDTKLATEIQGNQGRLAFKGHGQPSQASTPPPQPSFILDGGGLVNKVSHLASHTTKLNGPLTIDHPPKDESAEVNPWIVDPSDAPAIKKKRAHDSGSDVANKAQKVVSKIKKVQRQNDNELEASTQVDVDAAMVVADGADGIDADCQGMLIADNPNAFTQKDLVKLAFAEDNVVQEFAHAKRQAIAEEAPQLEDMTLPGWGCWGGQAITKKPSIKRNFIRVVKKGVEEERRKDKQLNHVIINEKNSQKLEKYTVKELPTKFQTRTQYELNLVTPVGEEWNPSTSFHKKIKPRILTKKGHLIEPLAMEDH